MDNKLDCEIVQDLLPSYVDGLTNKTTNKAVEEHIVGCTGCAEALRLMKEPEQKEDHQSAQVDYLKKIRRRTSQVGMICGIVMMLLGMLIILSRVFLIGERAGLEDVNYSISVEGNTVYVSGNLASSTSGVARVTFEESAGIVNIKVYTAPKAFFNSSTITEKYTAQNEFVGMVRCDGMILWEGGSQISPTTARLYAAKNPYIGNMPSNADIAYILGVSDQLGPYSNELQTSKEPYGWKLTLENPIAADEESAARDIMAADSYVMLSVIDNLGYVTWEYTAASGSQEYRVTAEDASSFAGKDIKLCSQSPSELQSLMQSLAIKWSGVREALQETGSFRINIQNNSSDKIYGMVMYYYLDGKLLGTRGMSNADGSSLKQGDKGSFEFIPEDFPSGTSAIGLSGFSFDLYVVDSTGKETQVCKNMKVSAKYAWTFFFSLTGDFNTGFTINEG